MQINRVTYSTSPYFKGFLHTCNLQNFNYNIIDFENDKFEIQNEANKYLTDGRFYKIQAKKLYMDLVDSGMLEVTSDSIQPEQGKSLKDSYQTHDENGIITYFEKSNGVLRHVYFDLKAKNNSDYSAKAILFFNEDGKILTCLKNCSFHDNQSKTGNAYDFHYDENGDLKQIAVFVRKKPMDNDHLDYFYLFENGKLTELCKDGCFYGENNSKVKFEYQFKDDDIIALSKNCNVTFLDGGDEHKLGTADEVFVFDDEKLKKHLKYVKRNEDKSLDAHIIDYQA